MGVVEESGEKESEDDQCYGGDLVGAGLMVGGAKRIIICCFFVNRV